MVLLHSGWVNVRFAPDVYLRKLAKYARYRNERHTTCMCSYGRCFQHVAVQVRVCLLCMLCFNFELKTCHPPSFCCSDLEETLLWTLLNSGVALIGYWLAAAVVDNPKIGRLRLQLLGFAADAILFYIAAAAYPSLTSKKGLPTFQFIYFFSSFWGQFGPNCTTFLLAGAPLTLSVLHSASC